jgi:hypothetical protein
MEAAAAKVVARGARVTVDAELASAADAAHSRQAASWTPLCSKPEQLFKIYSEEGLDRVVAWTAESGQMDLRDLSISEGLSEPTFFKFVGASLSESRLGRLVFDAAKTAISPEQGRNLVASLLPAESRRYSLEEHWRIAASWLLYFLPTTYRQPTGSSDLQRGTTLAEITRR